MGRENVKERSNKKNADRVTEKCQYYVFTSRQTSQKSVTRLNSSVFAAYAEVSLLLTGDTAKLAASLSERKDRKKGKMNIEELQQAITQRTGIPAQLLTGETTEEILATAKALLAYRREHEAQRPKSTRELFAEWLAATTGEDLQDAAGAALAEIEEAVRLDAGGYPIVHDGGNPYINGRQLPDGRTPQQQLADWIAEKSAFDPSKEDGWKPVL